MKSQTVSRGLMELALIVLGVLIALGFDAWWSERTKRASESAYIAELRTEFVDLIFQADSMAERARRNRDGLSTLDGLLELRAENVPTDSLQHLAESLWYFQQFQPVMPTYEEFKISIGLSEVSDPGLRRALFRLEAALSEAAYYDQYLLSATVAMWEPVLTSRIPAPFAMEHHRRLLRSREELASDLSFRNVVSERRGFEDGLATVRAAVAEVARAVTVEVDRVRGGGS